VSACGVLAGGPRRVPDLLLGLFSQLVDIYRLFDIATQEARKAETRQRLIDAAADLFATTGVHAVSLDAIADAADRTTGAIYSHFGGKVGLLLAVLDQTSRQVGRDARAALDRLGDTDARLETLWRTFVARADDPDDPWMLLEHELWLYAARNPEARAQLADRFRHTRAIMDASFEAWVGNGDATRDAPPDTDTATLVLAMLYGLEMQRRVDPSSVPDQLAVQGLRALLGVAGARPDEPEPTTNARNHERQHSNAH
jgi:AcrR family transcriptional regulator